jgi:hypothetical protein
MKKIRQVFNPKKTSAIFPTEKDVTHDIITLAIMVISNDAFHQSVIFKAKKEASNGKADASKPTALIHLHPLTCELDSNDSLKT